MVERNGCSHERRNLRYRKTFPEGQYKQNFRRTALLEVQILRNVRMQGRLRMRSTANMRTGCYGRRYRDMSTEREKPRDLMH